MCHDSLICVTWPIYMCDIIQSCTATWRTATWRTHSYVWPSLKTATWFWSHIWMKTATWRTATWRTATWRTHSFCHDSFICVPWFTYMCDIIQSCTATWRTTIRRTHSYVWPKSATWKICVWLCGPRYICNMAHAYKTKWKKKETCNTKAFVWLLELQCMCDVTHVCVKQKSHEQWLQHKGLCLFPWDVGHVWHDSWGGKKGLKRKIFGGKRGKKTCNTTAFVWLFESQYGFRSARCHEGWQLYVCFFFFDGRVTSQILMNESCDGFKCLMSWGLTTLRLFCFWMDGSCRYKWVTQQFQKC